MRIAVVGGTGTAGSAVVRHARARGHHVAVLARSTGVDVTHGGELVSALQGMDGVVDATNAGVSRRRPAVAWFEGAARSLTDAAHRARVGLIVPLSIVGIDDVPLGYYEGKRAQEAVVQGSPVPWTIVRATQFFSFPSPFLDRARAGVALIPALRCQPVAVEAVARLVVDALESPERGQVLQVQGLRSGTRSRWRGASARAPADHVCGRCPSLVLPAVRSATADCSPVPTHASTSRTSTPGSRPRTDLRSPGMGRGPAT